jgi:hypothetical protein
VLLAGVLVAAVALIAVAAFAKLHSPSGLASRPSQVAFDDDFSTNRGWDLASDSDFTADLTLGHPGTLHLTSGGSDIGHPQRYPGAGYRRVKIVAMMTRRGGSTDFGISCVQAEYVSQGYHAYQFWVGSDGTAQIDADIAPGESSTLATKDVAQWNAGESHAVTAVCYSDGKTANLELLVDGNSVLTASDTRFAGPFVPAILLGSESEVDVRRFTVSTVS